MTIRSHTPKLTCDAFQYAYGHIFSGEYALEFKRRRKSISLGHFIGQPDMWKCS